MTYLQNVYFIRVHSEMLWLLHAWS